MTADFDGFFRGHYPPVVVALSFVVGSRHLAEDAAQHAFYQALRRWERVKAMDNPVGWVYVVALRWVRRSHRWAVPPDRLSGEGSDASVRVVDQAMLRDAVAQLTPRQRTVFVLRHVAELPASDVAASLGINPATVRVLDHQARLRLQHVLGPEYRSQEPLDAP